MKIVDKKHSCQKKRGSFLVASEFIFEKPMCGTVTSTSIIKIVAAGLHYMFVIYVMFPNFSVCGKDLETSSFSSLPNL